MKYLILVSLLMGSYSFAEFVPFQTKTVAGEADLNMSISHVQKQITLVQKYSTANGSDLRVNFLAMDYGGSTDVSPNAGLYLTTHNESEGYDAGSAHYISHMNDFVSTKRLQAGIYEAVVRTYNYGYEQCESNFENNYQPLIKLTVDARDLTIAVRKLEGVEFFDYKTFTNAVYVKAQCL